MTGKNLFRLGLGLLLLGLVFLFRHAIEEEWIGPAARVGAGVVISLALVGIGLRIDARRPSFGQLLQGGGIAGLYLTAFAAHRVYGMVDETAAFVQLATIAAAGVGLAVRARSEVLASVSMLGALAAPLLIEGRMTGSGGDAIYLAVVLAATGVMFQRFSWTWMWWITQAALGLIVSADLVRLQLGLDGAPTALELQFVLLAAWLAFYVLPLVLRWSGDLSGDGPVLAGTIVTTPALAAASYIVWAPTASSAAMASAAATLAAIYVGARALLVGQAEEVADWQLLPASLFAVAATVLAFDGPVLVFLLAAEAVAIAGLGRRTDRHWVEYVGHSAFGTVLAAEGAHMLADGPTGSALLNGPALARIGIIGLAVGAASILDTYRDPTSLALRSAYVGLALAGLLTVLWVELSPVSQAAVTSAWGITGVGVSVFGEISRRRKARLAGIGVILVAVAKLFIVDLASAEPIWRIAVFAGFGAVLLVVGYWMSNDD